MLLSSPMRNGVFMALSVMLATGVAGCTVEPLYGSANRIETSSVQPASGRLASIAISDVATREAQQVRNHLVFLLNGGAREPAAARYVLDLTLIRRNLTVAEVQVNPGSDTLDPTAGTLELEAVYVLKDIGTGEVVAQGRRRAMAAYDRPRQYFGSWRTERDAEDRAARELAVNLRTALAQDLSGSNGG